MNNPSIICLIFLLLLFGGSACKNNPLAGITEQDKCEIPGVSKPKTSDDYVDRALKRGETDDLSDEIVNCSIADCSAALRLDPKNTEALACRAAFYLVKNEYDLALEDINEALRLTPQESQLFLLRSLIYTDKGLLDEALADLNKVIDLSDSTGLATDEDFSRRADIYYAKGDYANAIKDYEQATGRGNDNHAEYFRNIAKVYRRLNPKVSRPKSKKNILLDILPDESEKYEQIAKGWELREKNSALGKDANDSKTTSSNQAVLPKSVSAGVLNIKAIDLPEPVYPAQARAAGAGGAVILSVEVDESGNVLSAQVISGHPLLRPIAEQATRNTKFEPITINGKPVNVTGILVFNFVSE
ncbi:MAG: TonB family protein [Acidobacteria bacterium]|jgi:TonB family protein|nr:TonB family protein [Acidobacteriota bacterium]